MPKKTETQPGTQVENDGAAPAESKPARLDHAETVALLRRNLKVLLFHLASKSDSPSEELEEILAEVIQELYFESKQALEDKKKHLKLISTPPNEF